MSLRLTIAGCVLGLLGSGLQGSSSLAQEILLGKEIASRPVPVQTTAAQPEAPPVEAEQLAPAEGSLPEVIVRPEVPGDSNTSTAPSSTLAPPAASPFSMSEIYPGLSNQIIGQGDGVGLDSVLRG